MVTLLVVAAVVHRHHQKPLPWAGGIGGGGNGSGNVCPVPVGPPVYVPYPGNPTSTNYAQDGAARLGGGGGGGRNSVPSYRGGRGGSGVAMIRYAYPAPLV